MKTAISIPDEVFARAEQEARSKGCTRSELFTRAIVFYLETGAKTAEAKIAQINQLVDDLGSTSFEVQASDREQLNRLADEGW